MDLDIALIKSHHYTFISLCSYTAFTGRFCEEDRNGCSEIQCFEGVECFDVPAPGVGAVCGACPQGYAGDAQKCYGPYFYRQLEQ